MKKLLLILSLLTFLYSSEESNTTQKENSLFNINKSLFVSDEDGRFDISKYLSTKYGFMPMPLIVTEPAIGYGGGLNLMFLHDSLTSSVKRKSPPSISGVAGIGTENDTLFGAAYHLGFWREDTIRTTTAAAALNVNMNFYLRNTGIDMNLKGYGFYQEVMFRINDSNFFLGGNYAYADIKTTKKQ